MAETFHPDFYVACATVIPVLFLAVAVQARDYETLLARGQHHGLLRGLLLAIAYVSVILGGVGEGGALWELLERQNASGWRVTVFVATFLLLFVVLYSPFFGFLRATFRSLRDNSPTAGRGGAVAQKSAKPAPGARGDRGSPPPARP